MSGFETREDGFENKFAYDEGLKFKVEARCCKLFGMWLAEEIGLSGDDIETYAKQVISSNLEEPGFDDVKRKVMPDIEEKGLDISEHIIDKKLEHFMKEAYQQIKAGD